MRRDPTTMRVRAPAPETAAALPLDGALDGPHGGPVHRPANEETVGLSPGVFQIHRVGGTVSIDRHENAQGDLEYVSAVHGEEINIYSEMNNVSLEQSPQKNRGYILLHETRSWGAAHRS